MPVLALFTGNIKKAQYETLRAEVDWENKHPAGGIFHAASFDEAGNIHVADVWETAEDLNTFVQAALLPVFQKHNIAPPSVSVYPTHLVRAYASVAKYRI